MRHLVAGRKLGRTTEHRWALFRNLLIALIEHERIETTLPKAKELRSFADHLITLGKKNTLWARRQAFDLLRSRELVGKLFSEVAPRFESRHGGYTRIFRLGYRLGDSAPMAIIEYIPETGIAEKKEEKPAQREAPKKEPKAKKEAAKPAKKKAARKEEPKKKAAKAKKK